MRLKNLLSPALACVTLASAATTLDAQRLKGTVTLPDGTTPAPGTLIAARDTAGRDVTHTVALEDGTFSFFVDSTKTLVFTAERVGFQPTPIASRRFRDGETDSVKVVLGALPLALPNSAPRNASSCGGRGEGRAAVEALLGEARKVMLAAQFRLGRPDARARITNYQHRTAKNGEDTLYTMMRRADGSPPALFEETPTEELERRGFFAKIAAERVFAAPGIETLTSAWFAETHCFTLAKVTKEEYLLRFSPARERKGLVDVSGEYRFDRITGGLSHVTYEYVGLPQEEKDSKAGGRIDFAKMSNGNWVALNWNQRFPLLGYRTASGATTFVQSSMTLVDIIGHRVVGGRTNAVLANDRPVFRHDPVPGPARGAPARDSFAALCPERVVTANTSAARGKLVAHDSLGVDRVVVRAAWKVLAVVDRTQMSEREHVRETLSDPEGNWVLCDMPVNRDIELSWKIRDKETKVPLTFTQPAIVTVVP